MISHELPSFCYSGRALEIGGIVIHYFSAKNVDADNRYDMDVCRRLFIDLNREQSEREWYLLEGPKKRMYASAHLLIGRAGEVWKLIELDKQAYHAGKSMLSGKSNCNQWTLGIELVGEKTSGFTDAQYEALGPIVDEQMFQHGFSIEYVAGHDDVRNAAIADGQTTTKKYDPSGQSDGRGDNFDWARLYAIASDQ